MPETFEVIELSSYQPEIGAALWRLEDTRNRTLGVLNKMPVEVKLVRLLLLLKLNFYHKNSFFVQILNKNKLLYGKTIQELI